MRGHWHDRNILRLTRVTSRNPGSVRRGCCGKKKGKKVKILISQCKITKPKEPKLIASMNCVHSPTIVSYTCPCRHNDNIHVFLFFQLPIERVEDAVVAQLPDPSTRLPREKPVCIITCLATILWIPPPTPPTSTGKTEGIKIEVRFECQNFHHSRVSTHIGFTHVFQVVCSLNNIIRDFLSTLSHCS